MSQHKEMQYERLHITSSHTLRRLLGILKKISQSIIVSLAKLYIMNWCKCKNRDIYWCTWSILCLFQKSMIFSWLTDPKSNDLSMDIFLSINFKNFHLVTFPWSWNRFEFQGWFKSCRNSIIDMFKCARGHIKIRVFLSLFLFVRSLAYAWTRMILNYKSISQGTCLLLMISNMAVNIFPLAISICKLTYATTRVLS